MAIGISLLPWVISTLRLVQEEGDYRWKAVGVTGEICDVNVRAATIRLTPRQGLNYGPPPPDTDEFRAQALRALSIPTSAWCPLPLSEGPASVDNRPASVDNQAVIDVESEASAPDTCPTAPVLGSEVNYVAAMGIQQLVEDGEEAEAEHSSSRIAESIEECGMTMVESPPSQGDHIASVGAARDHQPRSQCDQLASPGRSDPGADFGNAPSEAEPLASQPSQASVDMDSPSRRVMGGFSQPLVFGDEIQPERIEPLFVVNLSDAEDEPTQEGDTAVQAKDNDSSSGDSLDNLPDVDGTLTSFQNADTDGFDSGQSAEMEEVEVEQLPDVTVSAEIWEHQATLKDRLHVYIK